MDEHNAPKTSDYEFLRKREMWMRLIVNRGDLGTWARVVGMHIALRMTEARPYAWPGQATIAKSVGCQRATVMRAIAELRDAGLLTATSAKLGDDAKKESRSFTYRLRMPFE